MMTRAHRMEHIKCHVQCNVQRDLNGSNHNDSTHPLSRPYRVGAKGGEHKGCEKWGGDASGIVRLAELGRGTPPKPLLATRG